MQTAEIQALSDRDLLVQMFEADRLLGDVDEPVDDLPAAESNAAALSGEVDRRFGEGACENISSWSVVTKASHEDLIRMAQDETEHMIDLARGHACDNGSLTATGPRQARCWCGHYWHRLPGENSWREGFAPSKI